MWYGIYENGVLRIRLYSHLDQIGKSLVEGRREKEKRGGALLELHVGPVVAELVVRLSIAMRGKVYRTNNLPFPPVVECH